MTDRIHSLTVVLQHNLRSDDVQKWIDAISLLTGVVSVTPNVADLDSHMAEERARDLMRRRLFIALEDKR